MKRVAICAALLLASCSSQTVQLEPKLTVAPFPGANGKLVALAVRDERPTALIGTRGTDTRLGDITAAGDVQLIVAQALSVALSQMGFRVLPATATSASLVVDVRHLDFQEHAGVVSGKSVAEAAVNARVMRGSAIVMERLYRGSSAKGGVFVGSASANSRLINGAINDALQKLATDHELLAALATT